MQERKKKAEAEAASLHGAVDGMSKSKPPLTGEAAAPLQTDEALFVGSSASGHAE